MLGYLNAPSPFTEDGWFITGDEVEVKGEYIKILGRKSDIINVGGEKVYPSEVESVIQEIKEVLDVSVFGESNPILGNVVVAQITTLPTIDKKEVKSLVKKFCKSRLDLYKVPTKIKIIDKAQFSERFKKVRKAI